jgi:hypothetical protein
MTEQSLNVRVLERRGGGGGGGCAGGEWSVQLGRGQMEVLELFSVFWMHSQSKSETII